MILFNTKKVLQLLVQFKAPPKKNFQTNLIFTSPVQPSIYGVFNPQGSKFLTRLRLGLSQLSENRFRHNLKSELIHPALAF